MQVSGTRPCCFGGVPRSSPGVREREGPEERGGAGAIGPAELTVFPLQYRGGLVSEGSPGTVALASQLLHLEKLPALSPGLGSGPPLASPRPLRSGARLPP